MISIGLTSDRRAASQAWSHHRRTTGSALCLPLSTVAASVGVMLLLTGCVVIPRPLPADQESALRERAIEAVKRAVQYERAGSIRAQGIEVLQRVRHGVDALSATQVLELGTLGGAQVLGRDDIGVLGPDMAADFIGFNLRQIGFTGALHDPIAALAFCAPSNVSFSVVNGKVVVKDGSLVGVDMSSLMDEANELAKTLVKNAERNTGRNFSEVAWKRAL